MKQVYLMADPVSPTMYHEVEDVTTFLMSQYGRNLPSGVRIYHQGVGASNDVTPGGSRSQVEKALKRLRRLPGPFYVVNHPGDVTGIGWIIAAVVVAAVAAAVLLRPKLPNVASKQQQALESPNNSLSERTNEPRVNGRVPDIVGTVRSFPDLLSNTYNIYTAHVKREVSYMCIGKGSYQIHDLKDDTTPISEISGATAEVYGPNTSPNSGHSPQIRVGDPINIPLLINKKIDSVNGQTLIANDAGSVVRKAMKFQYPNEIISQDGTDFTETFVPGDIVVVTEASQADGTFVQTADANFEVQNTITPTWGEITMVGDLSADWKVGDLMTITNGTVTWEGVTDGGEGYTYTATANVNGMYPVIDVHVDITTTTIRLDITGNNSAWRPFKPGVTRIGNVEGTPTLSRPSTSIQFNLAGTYNVVTVTSTTLTLNNPESVNSDWLVMEDDYGGISNTLYPVIATSGDRWVGWFTVKFPRVINRVIANFTTPGGLFALDDDGEQRKRNVAVRLEAQRVDSSGNPYGAVHAFEQVIEGSATTRAKRAVTINAELVNTPHTDWRFRARRITPTDHNFDGEIIDEVVWEDLYVASNVSESHFGDVTTVYTLTAATEGATSIKSRRFNSLVTRKIPLRIEGDQFTTDLHPTNNAAEILSFLALDPTNGRRTKAQVDFDSIYDAHAAVVAYFGTPAAGEFCYTFSSDVLSFEEIATQIAQAMFCQAYRRGSKLKLLFERQTEQRAMLFNHRNVLPGTEEYSGSFGNANARGSDGVQFQWIDPETDAVANINLPADGSALKPLKLESVGIRNYYQAHFHAWREYQKLLFQRKSKTFDSLYMANLLIPKNVVLCADGCRPETVSGEIVDADGLLLYLDQDVDWSIGTDPYIYIQTQDISTDAIPISPGPTPNSVTLSRAPLTPVVTQESTALTTGFTITFSTNRGTLRPYLVVEKTDKQNMVVGMQVVEYTDKIYSHDKDFINGII